MVEEGQGSLDAKVRDLIAPMSTGLAARWVTFGVVLLMTLMADAAIADSGATDRIWTSKTLRFNLTVRNVRDAKTGDEHLNVYVPATTTNQRLVSIDATQPFVEEIDDLGNHMLVFTLRDLAPFATRRISITSIVDMTSVFNDTEAPHSGVFEGDEPMVESDHPEIRALAMSIEKDRAADYVDRVYQWVRNNLTYAGFVADDLGALSAFKTRRGDCSEYAYLVAALDRVRGIPTKVLGGYVVSSNAVVKASEYHNWNEVYLDGKWQLVDAQKGAFLTGTNDYVVTRIVSRRGIKSSDEFVHRYGNPEGGLTIEMD